jgi:hypothetical protein
VKFSENLRRPLTSGPFLGPSLSVRALQQDIQQLQTTEGVIARREHPKLASSIDWLVRNGGLRAVLPGVYARPEMCDSINTRVRALMRWHPDAILSERALLGCPSGPKSASPGFLAAFGTSVGHSWARSSLAGRFR